MIATGIVRKVDELGRIVIPIELRRTLDIEIGSPIEIYVNGDTIILTKFLDTCYICNGTKELRAFKRKNVCVECIKGAQHI